MAAKTSCAGADRAYSTKARAAAALPLSAVTAIGFWIRIVSSGMTYSTGSPACWAVIASFSYASSTSPLPAVKTCSDSRAPLGCTGTFSKSWRRYSSASCLVFPCSSWAP